VCGSALQCAAVCGSVFRTTLSGELKWVEISLRVAVSIGQVCVSRCIAVCCSVLRSKLSLVSSVWYKFSGVSTLDVEHIVVNWVER